MPTVARGLYRWLFSSGARLEDFADRLNHFWTFGLVLLLGIVISWKHGYSNPISCWCPPDFPGAAVVYTQQTCWHSYYIGDLVNAEYPQPSFGLPIVRQEVPEDERDAYNTTYYQWVPVILCLQALLFKLPNIILYIFHSYSGVDFDKVAGLTVGYENLSLTERQNLANQISRYIYRWCAVFPKVLPWRILTVLWFLVKCMYCINIVMQMAYIDKFLKTTNEPYDNSTSYGSVIYDNIAKNNGSFWKQSPVFPQKVMCSFEIIQLRNTQTWLLQCDLNANRFTERAYMFLWVWLLFVAIVTMLSFTVWVILTLVPIARQSYIRRFLEINAETTAHLTDKDVALVTSVVGEDGVMVLKLIAANSSELLVRDVVYGISNRARGGATSGHLPIGESVAPTAPPGVYPSIELEKVAPEF